MQDSWCFTARAERHWDRGMLSRVKTFRFCVMFVFIKQIEKDPFREVKRNAFSVLSPLFNLDESEFSQEVVKRKEDINKSEKVALLQVPEKQKAALRSRPDPRYDWLTGILGPECILGERDLNGLMKE
ncbi:hypothetical protein CEXT_43661 [Caerostris extrusa]|uniref:Uncharacterized protein n=1 Tax=Caerostris extrusa TaxID=172846 RepID=A0AAV4YA51_CAEEX|nr:hypothetical protein CEXT_43661 [Caerostris extrusa]